MLIFRRRIFLDSFRKRDVLQLGNSLRLLFFCFTLQGITGDDRWLRGITFVYRGLQGITGGYKGLQGVTRGYRGLQVATRGYRGLEGVARGYKGLQEVTLIFRRRIFFRLV